MMPHHLWEGSEISLDRELNTWGEFAYANDNANIPPHNISLVNGGNVFHGRDDEDPMSHLNVFYELTNSHRPPNVEHHRIKRTLFPFSLRESKGKV